MFNNLTPLEKMAIVAMLKTVQPIDVDVVKFGTATVDTIIAMQQDLASKAERYEATRLDGPALTILETESTIEEIRESMRAVCREIDRQNAFPSNPNIADLVDRLKAEYSRLSSKAARMTR